MTEDEREQFNKGVEDGKADRAAAKRIRNRVGVEQHLDRWRIFDWMPGKGHEGMTARWQAYRSGFIEGYFA
jgi:hypothetical protein